MVVLLCATFREAESITDCRVKLEIGNWCPFLKATMSQSKASWTGGHSQACDFFLVSTKPFGSKIPYRLVLKVLKETCLSINPPPP
ncbi:MAG: hypothetical protein BYD32DRAFT_429162, partial [Podila humilis]